LVYAVNNEGIFIILGDMLNPHLALGTQEKRKFSHGCGNIVGRKWWWWWW